MNEKLNDHTVEQPKKTSKEDLVKLIKSLDVSLLVNQTLEPFDDNGVNKVHYQKVEDMF